MGISANQARLLTLTARQHDLELRAQQISARKMALMHKSQSFALAFSNNLSRIQGQNVASDYIPKQFGTSTVKFYQKRTDVVLYNSNNKDVISNATVQAIGDDAIANKINLEGYLPCTVSYPAPAQTTPIGGGNGNGNVDVQATNAVADAIAAAGTSMFSSTNVAEMMFRRNPNSTGQLNYSFQFVRIQPRSDVETDGQKRYDVVINDLRDRLQSSSWDTELGVNLDGDTLENYNRAINRYYSPTGNENEFSEYFAGYGFLQGGAAYVTAQEITDCLGMTVYGGSNNGGSNVVPPSQNQEPIYTPIDLNSYVVDYIPFTEQTPPSDVPTYEDVKAEYDANMASLSSIEKMLDMELTQIDTEHKAVKTEYDAIKSLISDNVEKSFNVFG